MNNRKIKIGLKREGYGIVRRPICIIAIFYILGILMQYIFYISYKEMLEIFCLILIAGVFVNKKKYISIILLVVIVLLGALNYKVNNEYGSKWDELFNKKAYVVGDVVDVSYKDRMQLTLKVVELVVDKKKYIFSSKLLVKLRGEYNQSKDIIGKRVGVYGVILEPQKRRNPKMFDYQMYLKTKKIYAILYGQTTKVNIIRDGDISFVIKGANRIKNNIVYIVLNTLPKKEGNILLGILLGDKDGLDIDVYKTFKRVGIVHILAVSGLHVGILYMFLNKLLKGFPLGARTFIILAIFYFYVIITGCASSVLRATLMATILICAPLLNRRYDSLSTISTVALLLLIINPMVFINVGFQFSFIATLFIILLYKKILIKLTFMPEFLGRIFAVFMAAQIGMIPVVAYHFNYISLGALIVNIPIVIIVSLIVQLGLIMIMLGFISLPFAAILGHIVFYLIKIVTLLSKCIASMYFCTIEVISPSIFFICIYYILFLLFMFDENKTYGKYFSKKQGIVITISVYMIITFLVYIIPNKLEITFVDVGQGDCIYIQTPKGKNILIDGGGSHQKTKDVGEDIVVPYLRKNGISKIDLMILSHIHRDHIGGLLCVLDHLKVNTLMIGTEYYQSEDLDSMKEKCINQKTKICHVKKDDTINIDEHIYIKILHPSKQLITGTRDDTNNNCLVALMVYKDKHILFTGDIEEEAEREILKNYKNLSVDVLKVAHHGSRFSSTDNFIKSIKPKIGIVQVGKNNFGHPDKEVLNRFKNNGTYLFRNDKNGAVIVTIDEENIKAKRMIQ